MTLPLLRVVEKYLREHNMPPTKFGRTVMHDPRFVFDLRMGSEPRPKTEEKVRKWIKDNE